MLLSSKILVNSILSAGCGGLTCAILGKLIEGYYSISRVCNGILSGLVSITGSCSIVNTGSSLFIGLIGSIIYYIISIFIVKIKIDDPLDAFPVHGCCGIWGLLSVSLFSTKNNIKNAGYNNILSNSSRGYLLLLQLFGIFIILLWIIILCGLMFYILKITKLRISDKEEIIGLDKLNIVEML